jgi:hypothetical protein
VWSLGQQQQQQQQDKVRCRHRTEGLLQQVQMQTQMHLKLLMGALLPLAEWIILKGWVC